MPIGRRFFGPEAVKAPAVDDFAAAEMAAAIEAVDALDESAVVERTVSSRPGPGASRGYADQSDLIGAVDATAADESIALRIALVSGMPDLEAAEREAARAVDEESSDAFEAAEAIASSALRAWDTPREARAPVRGIDADEFDAAEAEATSFVAVEPIAPVGPAESGMPAVSAAESIPADFDEFADADAAEAAAAAEAVREVSNAEAAMESEPAHVRKSFPRVHDSHADEPSEQEAESQALREALALVLDGDGQAGDQAKPAAHHAHKPAAEPVAPAVEPTAESTPPSDAGTQPEASPEPAPRKGGLFHRIRGN
jgi:hypothetical protein